MVVARMDTLQKVYRVGISGSYGGLNLGDEAMLEVILAQLRRSLPVEITVFSRHPEDTLACHRVERAGTAREVQRVLQQQGAVLREAG
jgi:polysaccharide pyruvyl transferase WcaK-like protein